MSACQDKHANLQNNLYFAKTNYFTCTLNYRNRCYGNERYDKIYRWDF